MPVIVPSLVSTFSTPSMSWSVSSAVNVCNLQNGTIRNIADCSAVFALPLLDQAFVVGPGFLPVPAKIVTQIIAGKFIDLSELLAVNLVKKDPELQLLLDGRLVLTSQPKKKNASASRTLRLGWRPLPFFLSFWLRPPPEHLLKKVNFRKFSISRRSDKAF